MNMNARSVRIGLLQLQAGSQPQKNLKKTLSYIQKAADKGAQIIGLQELFNLRYFCREYSHQFFDLAETIPGPTTEALAKIAQKNQTVIVAPLFEKRAAGVYHNSAAVINADGGLLGVYRKMHIPDDPQFYEKFYFSPGDLGFKVFHTRYASIGVLICWDQWFPEAARLTALSGAQILFYPTAIGYQDIDKAYYKHQKTGWETIQRGHAVANEVFVAATNRVGREGTVNFWGHSFIADPFGSLMACADETSEQVLIADCNLALIEETRRHWPFLRDRRTDAYAGITERYLDSRAPAKVLSPRGNKTKLSGKNKK